MDLPTIWFVAIAVLWTGYFVLEGFDFGVGILLPVLGRDDTDRRVMINAIGPVWDGNEVWLITAVSAMFAAFPAWYGATLSGFYVPVLLIVLALIGRGVAFEYRGKGDGATWKARWDAAIVVGSAVPAFLWGLVFANILRGVELGADGVVRSSLLDLLNPYALLGGLTTLALFTLHGAFFLGLKTDGPVRRRALRTARRVAPVATAAVFAFLVWTQAERGLSWVAIAVGLAVTALLAAAVFAGRRREGWAFAATAVAIATFGVAVFGSLFPTLLPSTAGAAFDLTVTSAASGPYALGVMSVVGAVFLPLVIGYQSWSYWVFRRRVTRAHVGA
ncbi:cytochrome d ubiquinol oxidase subunit II [Pseudonocardia sp. GCM10023141]|uniref:cytochrome d ubiquinol oxidase subunit II n=1 Tax=Pseudonocardia sp. GCM10023141 TaxID=3252653 RepID=UPI00360A77D2